jgi:predicted component of type VI protein secretion system
VAYLRVFYESKSVGEYSFTDGRIRVGRHPMADIFLPHRAVSRLQCTLSPLTGGWRIEAAGKNTIFVNDKAVGGAHHLSEGDRITFAQYVLVFSLSESLVDEESDPLAGVVSSASAPRPTGGEVDHSTHGLSPEQLDAFRERANEMARPHLAWRTGAKHESHILRPRGTFIGASPKVDVRIAGGLLVAGRHARVVHGAESYVVAPCSWWTRVRVNGERIKDSTVLENGDEITIGKTVITYRVSAYIPSS